MTTGGAPQAARWQWAADRLGALGFPNRLRLLSILQHERVLDEIRLSPAIADEGRESRVLTRQGVQYHLDKLRDTNLLKVRRESRGGQVKNVYRVDHAQVYALSEVLRDIALHGEPLGIPVEPGNEGPLEQVNGGAASGGPHVSVVHGLELGRTFPLSNGSGRGDRGWVIGNDDDVDVSLPWDPYLEPENAEIIPQDPGYELLDLREARSRTRLNGEELGLGKARPLSPGDRISIGRSLLVFHA